MGSSSVIRRTSCMANDDAGSVRRESTCDGAPTNSYLHIMCAIPHSDGHVFWRVALIRLEIHIQGQLLRSTQAQLSLSFALGTCNVRDAPPAPLCAGTLCAPGVAASRQTWWARNQEGGPQKLQVSSRVHQAVEGKTKHTHCQNVSLLLSRSISTPLPGFADVTVHTESGVKTQHRLDRALAAAQTACLQGRQSHEQRPSSVVGRQLKCESGRLRRVARGRPPRVGVRTLRGWLRAGHDCGTRLRHELAAGYTSSHVTGHYEGSVVRSSPRRDRHRSDSFAETRRAWGDSHAPVGLAAVCAADFAASKTMLRSSSLDVGALVEIVRERARAGARREAALALEQLSDAATAPGVSADDGATVLVTAATLAADLDLRRKRLLFLWRAATLLRSDPARSLALLSSIVPPDDGGLVAKATSGTGLHPLQAWPSIQRAVLWEALTRATRCADALRAWDLASRLLRVHCPSLSPAMQAALVRALHAASALFPGDEATAAGREAPPPSCRLIRVSPLPQHRRPMLALTGTAPGGYSAPGSGSVDGKSIGGASSVFVFSPFERSRAQAAAKSAHEAGLPMWVVGEPAEVVVSLSNPTVVPLRLDGLSLVTAQPGGGWEPHAGGDLPGGALTLPPGSTDVEVTLRGCPTRSGVVTFTGLAIDAFGGVWHTPWQPRTGRRPTAEGTAIGAAIAVAPLPLLAPQLSASYGDGASGNQPQVQGMLTSPWSRTVSGNAPGFVRRISGGDMDSTPPASPLRPTTPASSSRRSMGTATMTPGSGATAKTSRGHSERGTSSRVRRSRSALFGSGTNLSSFGGEGGTMTGPVQALMHQPPVTVSCYEGQTTHLRLNLTNVGPTRAVRAEAVVADMLHTSSGSAATVGGLPLVTVHHAALAAMMPIPQGGTISVPLVWHGHRRGGGGGGGAGASSSSSSKPSGGTQQYNLTVVVRYWGDRPEPETDAPQSSPASEVEHQPHGRECRCELACTVLPGLRLMAATTRAIIGGGRSDRMMELDLRNDAPVSMDVRYCDTGPDEHGAVPQAVSDTDWLQIEAGARACLRAPSSTRALAWRRTGDPTVLGWVPHVGAALSDLRFDDLPSTEIAPARGHLSLRGSGVPGGEWRNDAAESGQPPSVKLGVPCTIHFGVTGTQHSVRSLAIRIFSADGLCCCPDVGTPPRVMWAGTPLWKRAGGQECEVVHTLDAMFLAPGVYTLEMHAQLASGEEGQEVWEHVHVLAVA